MRQFRCSICGFKYDETTGLLEKGIAPGVRWEDMPGDFACPWCAAPKAVFEEMKERPPVAAVPAVSAAPAEQEPEHHIENLRELTAGELSALCSNLAKGCEKQHLTTEMNLFYQLADYYNQKIPAPSSQGLAAAAQLVQEDLSTGYSHANATGKACRDRGALRALVWSDKVSRMVDSHLKKYAQEGNAMLENKKVYVCEICGFLYIGNDSPEICPVCKVPAFKISPVRRR